MPVGQLDEGWRQPVVDLSIAKDFGSDAHVLDVSNWLVQRQPISLAVNGDLALALKAVGAHGDGRRDGRRL